MEIVNKVLNCLAILLATILFVGLYDFGHLGFRETISSLASVPIALFAIFSIVPIFFNVRVGNSEKLDEEGLEGLVEKLEEVRTKTTSRISAMQSTLDEQFGQGNESLIEENKILKEQLETIQKAQRDEVLNNAEELRVRNVELEKHIRQWAIKTVGEKISEEGDGQTKAA